MSADAVKVGAVLAGPDSAPGLSLRVEASGGLDLREAGGGALGIYDEGGAVVFALPAPYAVESGSARPSGAASYAVQRLADGVWRIRVSVDGRWLAAAGRRFPVVIDPAVSVGPSFDCYISGGSGGWSWNRTFCPSSVSPYVYAGSIHGDEDTLERALHRFDLSAVPRDAQIQNAEFAAYAGGSGALPVPFAFNRLTRSFTHPGVNWLTYDGSAAWTAAGGDFDAASGASTNTIDASGWMRWYPTALVEGWFDGSIANHGAIVRSANEAADGEVAYRATVHPDPNTRPFLNVVYEPRTGILSAYSYDEQSLNDRMGVKVNVGNGNLVVSERDLAIPGTGLGLDVSRYYNSMSGRSGPAGTGWNLSVGADVRLAAYGDGSVTLYGPSGYAVPFRKLADGSFVTPPGINADLCTVNGGTCQGQSALALTFRGSSERWHFSSAGRLVAQTDRNGEDIQLAYDTGGKVTRITDTQDRDTTFSYLANGLLERMTDPAGRTYGYSYDTGGRLTSFQDAAGNTTGFQWDANNRLGRITDPEGNQTRFLYDTAGRVTRVTRVTDTAAGTGPTTEYAYSTASMAGTPCAGAAATYMRIVKTDPRGKQTTYCADAKSQVIKTVDPVTAAQQAAYNANGDPVSVDGPLSNDTTATTYGTGVNATDPVQTQTGGAAGPTETIEYQTTGDRHLPRKVTDPQGHWTEYAYDANGNRTQIKNGLASQNTITLGYDPAHPGWLTSVTDARGKVTTYGYDAKGNRTSITPPGPLGATTIVRDSLSRPQSVTDGKGQTTSIAYDALDRATTITYQGGSQATYSYDKNGNLTSQSDSDAQITNSYDKLNRLTETETKNAAGTQTLSRFSYAYDAAGNLTALTDMQASPSQTVSYEYDDNGRPTKAIEPGNKQTLFEHDPAGNRTKTTYPTTTPVTLNAAYDGQGRLSRLTNKRGAAVIDDWTYTYNDGTRDTSVIQSIGDPLARTTFSYDPLGRLATAIRGTEDDTYDYYSYGYDGAGNMTSRYYNGSSSAYTHNDANQLTSAGATTFTHDLNGGLTGSSAGLALSYNAKNQTTSITAPGGSATALAYAGAGQDRQLSIGATPQADSALGVTTIGAGASARRVTRDPFSGLVGERTPAGSYYFLFDHHGSVTGTVDAAGDTARTTAYDPYGQASTGGSGPNDFGYISGQNQPGGLVHFGARHYSPALGRWTQQDPREHPADPTQNNRYTYAGGDPVNFTDVVGCGRFTRCFATCYKWQLAWQTTVCHRWASRFPPVFYFQIFRACVAAAAAHITWNCVRLCKA